MAAGNPGPGGGGHPFGVDPDSLRCAILKQDVTGVHGAAYGRGSLYAMLGASPQPPSNSPIEAISLDNPKVKAVFKSSDRQHLQLIDAETRDLLRPMNKFYNRLEVLNDTEWINEGHSLEIGDPVLIYNKKSIPNETCGTLRYRGLMDGRKGIYFGIELDSQYLGMGTCDGTFRNVPYFECEDDLGLFVSIFNVRLNTVSGVRYPRPKQRREPRMEVDLSDGYDSILERIDEKVMVDESTLGPLPMPPELQPESPQPLQQPASIQYPPQGPPSHQPASHGQGQHPGASRDVPVSGSGSSFVLPMNLSEQTGQPTQPQPQPHPQPPPPRPPQNLDLPPPPTSSSGPQNPRPSRHPQDPIVRADSSNSGPAVSVDLRGPEEGGVRGGGAAGAAGGGGGDIPIKIGERVVWVSDAGPYMGTVRWIGKPGELDEGEFNITAGVELDEPVGTGTGRYRGRDLFRCPKGHAAIMPIMGLIRQADFDDKNTEPPRNRARDQEEEDIERAIAASLRDQGGAAGGAVGGAGTGMGAGVGMGAQAGASGRVTGVGAGAREGVGMGVGAGAGAGAGIGAQAGASGRVAGAGAGVGVGMGAGVGVGVQAGASGRVAGDGFRGRENGFGTQGQGQGQGLGLSSTGGTVGSSGVGRLGSSSSGQPTSRQPDSGQPPSSNITSNVSSFPPIKQPPAHIEQPESYMGEGARRKKPSQTNPNQPKPNQTNPNQPKPNQSKSPPAPISSTTAFPPMKPSENPNNLNIGSRVEILPNKYGVIKWIGKNAAGPQPDLWMVGILMDKPQQDICTAGTFLGEKMFECPPYRGFFGYLRRCKPDTRALPSKMASKDVKMASSSSRPGSQATSSSYGASSLSGFESIVSTPEMNESSQGQYVGRSKGIAGVEGASGVVSLLYAWFQFSCALDKMLSRPSSSVIVDVGEGVATFRKVRELLRNQILKPLRVSGKVHADTMEEVLTALKEYAVSANPNTNLATFFPENYITLIVRQIFNTTLVNFADGSGLDYMEITPESARLQDVHFPSTATILQAEMVARRARFSHPPQALHLVCRLERIHPVLELDVAPMLEARSQMCGGCWREKAVVQCYDCFNPIPNSVVGVGGGGGGGSSWGGDELAKTFLCPNCNVTRHQEPRHSQHRPIQLHATATPTSPVLLHLSAILCHDQNRYVAYVKTGRGSHARWVKFDSMASAVTEASLGGGGGAGGRRRLLVADVSPVENLAPDLTPPRTSELAAMKRVDMRRDLQLICLHSYMCIYVNEQQQHQQ